MHHTGVGPLVKGWRSRRRRSQLDLALDVGVSCRHLSFVETGRSRPSPELVLAIAERLDVPLRERNHMLLAAGYAPRFTERSLDDPAMARPEPGAAVLPRSGTLVPVESDALRTSRGVVVPAEAMEWSFARAGGPGGQHVNTSSTRASLRIDLTLVEASPAVRERLLDTLGPELRITSQGTRSQWRNRQECLALAAARLDDAARPPAPPRRPSRPGRGAVERRLEEKRKASQKKSARRPDSW